MTLLTMRQRSLLVLLAKYVVILAGAVVVLFPIYEMVSTSLKFDVDAFKLPPDWLFTPTLQNYADVLFGANFGLYFVNSVVVGVFATAASVAIGALAGYGLARWRFRGKTAIVVGTLLLRMIPPVILVVPVFVLFNTIRMTNGRVSLVLIYTALTLPFNIWVLRTFIMELPKELEESAIIDGCNDLTVFTRIVLPLIAPGLSVAGIFTFRIAWNEFILSLVLTNRTTRTLPGRGIPLPDGHRHRVGQDHGDRDDHRDSGVRIHLCRREEPHHGTYRRCREGLIRKRKEWKGNRPWTNHCCR
jgi:multiple sugar transport system permease protein